MGIYYIGIICPYSLLTTSKVVMYSSALAACGSSWTEALRLLEDMNRKQVQATAVPLNCAIHCCSQAGRWKEAILLLQTMELRKILADVVAYTSAMQACGAGGMGQLSVKLLRDMVLHGLQANRISFNVALAACSEWRQAVDLLQAALAKHLMLDAAGYNVVIDTMVGHAQWQHALALRDFMDTAKVEED